MAERGRPSPRPDLTGAPATDWETCLKTGVALARAGRAHDALPHLRRARLIRPRHFDTLQALASAQLRAGLAEEADGTFGAILRIDPRHVDARHGRALAQNALGDRAAALETFRQLVAGAPNAWRSWQSIADITPDEEERVAAVNSAAEALERLCAGGRAAPELYAACVTALVAARRAEEAAAFAQEQFSRFRSASAAHDKLAGALYRAGRFREAALQKASALASLPAADLPAAPRANPFEIATGIDALASFAAILEAAGIDYFLAAGTALGFHREGGPLAHDRDLDIGVIHRADGGPGLAGLIRGHPDLILDRGARPGDRHIPLHHQGAGIDLFVHDPQADQLVCGFSGTEGDVAWRFTAFQIRRRTFGEVSYPLPDPIGRYLAESYGEGWRTPDHGFASAISSPALDNVSPWVRAFYALARAKTALMRGDGAKARALLAQSPVRLPGMDRILPKIAHPRPNTEEEDHSR